MTPLKIDYIELTSTDMPGTQQFLSRAFGWSYTDYGPEYQELRDAGISGGIAAGAAGTAPLVILKAEDLEAAEAAVTAAGGTVTRPIYAFPGGRRFHFREPGGIEMAVWSGA